MERKSVYEVATERILTALSNGEIPWERPWLCYGEDGGCFSHVTGKPYSFLNQMLLPEEGEYITFNQCKAENGKVKKGAKGYPIFLYKTYEKEDEDNPEEKKTFFVLKRYTVFKLSDTEGVTPKRPEPPRKMYDGKDTPQRHAEAQCLVDDYLTGTGIGLRQVKSDSSYYDSLEDEIVLPELKQFLTTEGFYATAFHEMAHSTGRKGRLDRLPEDKPFDERNLAVEELTADISSAAILSYLGLDTTRTRENNIAYAQAWIKRLQADASLIIRAASRAQKAVDYIFSVVEE